MGRLLALHSILINLPFNYAKCRPWMIEVAFTTQYLH